MKMSTLFHPRLGLLLGYGTQPEPQQPRESSPPLPAHVARQPLNLRLLAVHVAAADRPRTGAAWE